jgi:hypothetical protein
MRKRRKTVKIIRETVETNKKTFFLLLIFNTHHPDNFFNSSSKGSEMLNNIRRNRTIFNITRYIKLLTNLSLTTNPPMKNMIKNR